MHDQMTDEQILSNTGENIVFDAFVLNLGKRIKLNENFNGYTGVLDIKGRNGDLLYR